MNRLITISVCLVCWLCSDRIQAQNKQILYLSGTDADHTVSWEFYCTGGRNSGEWKTIEVPSCWEQQGFGSYNYGRDYKTNGRNSRFHDEKGMYRFRFQVPSKWKGNIVRIIFEGSMTDTEVKINGHLAGPVHRGAFYQFQYDITEWLQFGQSNLLEVTVSKMSSDPSVNNAERLADYWIFGGIFRPVYLEAIPKQHIEYVGIDARPGGALAMRIVTNGPLRGHKAFVRISDKENKLVKAYSIPLSATDSFTQFKLHLGNLKSWSSETPVCYEAEVRLVDEKRRTVQTKRQTFGFREVEIRRGQGVFINGVQVKFKGVNRHCFWPETGRTLSKAQQLKDALLIREMNMNAVRCSHYPPDEYFLHLCDSLGIYVLDELAGWQKAYSTAAGEPLVKELVLRDQNHPSVIFWDNGNEGGTNKELDDDFTLWDFQRRPVIHPHHRPGNQYNGIDPDHYEDYYSTQRKLADTLIYMPTEFLHAQDDGGGGAGMEDFWELHWRSPRSAGGFIWAMVDEAVMRTDRGNVLDANGLNANDGILGPHREKEGSYYALRKIFSPLQLTRIESGDGAPAFIIENRFHFLRTSSCSFYWALVDFPGAFDEGDGYRVKLKGRVDAPDIAPLQRGRLVPVLPADYDRYDALVIAARDPEGREIYRWNFSLRKLKDEIGDWVKLNKDTTSIRETDSSFQLKGGEVSIQLDKRNGRLLAVRNSASDYALSFTNGPRLATGNYTVTGGRSFSEGDDRVVEFQCTGDLQSLQWRMNGSGWVRLDYAYTASGDVPFAGISFDYPENYVLSARWLGKGPCRQWKNRLAGTEVSVWSNLYNQTRTGYSPVVYPEFKGYYGEVSWMEISTVEGKFYVASPDEGMFVRLFDFYALSSAAKPHPELPPGDVSFLDAIPATGTKLAMGLTTNTRVYGPQSEWNHLSGQKQRSLYFYFGLPKVTTAKEPYARPKIDDVF